MGRSSHSSSNNNKNTMLMTTTGRRRGRRSRGSAFEVLSPCRTTTRRPSGSRPPLPSISAAQDLVPKDSRSRMSTTERTSRVTTTACDAELLVLGQKRLTSHGGRLAWSAASLLQRCPHTHTPKPTSSPDEVEDDDDDESPPSRASEVYYSQDSTDVSSAPRIQGSRVFDRVRSTSHGEVGIERTHDETRVESTPFPNRRPFSQSKQPRMKSIKGPSLVKLTTENADSVEHEGSNFLPGHHGNRIHRKLPAVEEEERGKFRRRSRGHLRIDYSSEEGSVYKNSEIESTIDEHLMSFMPPRSSKSRRDGVGGKLVQWKEARLLSLMNKLEKKVAEIDQWERKKTTMAKMEMKELEDKLERKREEAMEKMQGRIIGAHREAEKRRKAVKASMNKKMGKVEDTIEKIERTGKLPCKVAFP